jgi:Protein of unknown function (DUF1302)
MKKSLLALTIAAASAPVMAFQLDTPDDWDIRWDNTFKANLMSRVARQDKDVYVGRRGNSAFYLADDATLSVDRSGLGIVSARVDVLSELDVIYKQNFGFRVSASGWYDHAYRDSDHPKDRRYTWASPSVSPGEYSDEAEDLHYFGGEILDAFVFGNFDVGDAAIGVRAGRHTIYWGNSLLAGGAINGVGGSMAPIDFSKAFSVPGSEVKELFMPTAKLSTVIQLTDNLTLNGYYNLEHQRHRLPETGTYFSPAEGLTEDTEFATVPPGDPNAPFRTGFSFGKDKTESNEWGINAQYYVDAWNLETSFIYLNYVDKNLHGLHGGVDFGQVVDLQANIIGEGPLGGLWGPWNAICPAQAPCPNNAVVDPDAGTIVYGKGRWLFKEDIDMYAISLAKEIAGVSVGADIVYRQGTGLAPDLAASLGRFYNVPAAFEGLVGPLLPGEIIPGDIDSYDSDNYLGPVGDTWSVVVNGLGLLSDNGIWEGGSYIVEASFTMLDDCTDHCQLLDYRVEEGDVVSSLGVVFNPTWFQVFPGWDLSTPLSVSYTIDAEKSPFTFGGDKGRGNGSVGMVFNINETWNFAARYNVFFGPVSAGIGGLLKDRDNVSFTLKRTI